MAIAMAAASIRLLGVARTLRIATRPVRLASLAQGRAARDQAKIVIGDVVTAVDRAGRYVPGGTCLSKSLALAWMLRGRGIAAAVRIGVKSAGRFEAHAWVECDGVAIPDPSGVEARFTAIV
jgi:histidinol dehydrogenase